MLLLSQVAVAAPPPAEPYPAVPADEWARWEQILVVADIEPGQYHQAYPCPPNHICMDPPPFWFKAKVRATIYGVAVPDEIRVSTTSHYGMGAQTSVPGPLLLALRTNRDIWIMPRYAQAPLSIDKQGKLILKKGQRLGRWLPCFVPPDDIRIDSLRDLLQNAGRGLDLSCDPQPSPQPAESPSRP